MDSLSILLISGPLAVGKTSIREALIATHGYAAIQSSPYLKELAAQRGITIERANLQQLGDALDLETQFSWIVDDVALPQIAAKPEQLLWVVDSVRKMEQVGRFRDCFGSAITHVHFTCPESVLRERYGMRGRLDDTITYEQAISHPNEMSSRGLSLLADRIVDLGELTSEKAADLVAKWAKSIS
jgi:hypothetical protein